MDTTAIKKCKCQHSFQDKEFGTGNRVHNLMMKDKKVKGFRCTVCKHTIEVISK